MHNEGSSPKVMDCIFLGNVGGDGGGMANFNGSSPLVINCSFFGNTASDGGGMENQINCNPIVVNCVFSGNRASEGGNPDGGAVRVVNNSAPVFINCTFSGNTALRLGGGIMCYNSAPVFRNCIIWGNSDSGGTGEFAQIIVESGTAIVTSSCIQGCSSYCADPNDGNIGDDPLLLGPAGVDGTVGTVDDDLHLTTASPCIDAGDTSLLPAGLYVDRDGSGRVLDLSEAPNTGVPSLLTPATVDMGAYEYRRFRLPGDVNGDDLFNNADIDPFVALLSGS